ncbi:MAG TPA: B12-binding domain-containing radical SAM protein [Chitinophagales bacterium]|nr:B12-binding domain-containing radical SAM protein [Chitinophagales bacterium]
MKASTLLITPPFTQLNTPYPATAYLKGFLNTKSISSFQCDVGIEVILNVFSKNGLTKLFQQIETNQPQKSANATRIIALKQDYINTIDAVILFLQGKNATLANLICQEDFLPKANRFQQTDDLDWAFGNMGNHDKAKHLATLYLEDLSDLIIECIDKHFGFSRYAERLGRSANSFDELYTCLQKEYTFFDEILIEILSKKIKTIQPKLVAVSIPFPGNLYSAFRCAQWIKKNHPTIKIAFGGGFPNTELRSISDTRVFEFIDFITLDDGELPIELLITNLEAENPTEYKRTFLVENNKVVYKNNATKNDYKQNEVGTPDYADLLLDQYISVIEIANPMHKMWSDGRWNKLTMAHGCYWAKCTFCDISLDYIKVYEPIAAKLLCDRMETIMAQTGESGFHFVDEAAPPALMRALAIEIIKRKLVVSWWTNIRFEKSFTKDLCVLLKASGCIAVSGGLEVASDRLLALIDKGVTVEQVAKVNRNFTEAGIMVHSYLMYGYPTQTIQETIDSLEMVRQLFELGILQSGFWHQFAMTAHSPIGLEPEKFGVKKQTETIGTFANNDIFFYDETGIDHDLFSYGLKKSLLNYMHGIGFEMPLQSWFDFKVPKTTITPNYISTILNKEEPNTFQPSAKIIWLGTMPTVDYFIKTKKGNSYEMAKLIFHTKATTHEISINKNQAIWLIEILSLISVNSNKIYTLQEIKHHYEQHNLEDFELFWYNKPMNILPELGLMKF